MQVASASTSLLKEKRLEKTIELRSSYTQLLRAEGSFLTWTLCGMESDTSSIGHGRSLMTVPELLNGVISGRITEVQFMENFSKLFRGDSQMPGAEAQCLNEFVEDVNMAEHGGKLFDGSFLWRVEECLRLLSAEASASEIRSFFAQHRGS
jgi:hypothetical protein